MPASRLSEARGGQRWASWEDYDGDGDLDKVIYRDGEIHKVVFTRQ